MSGEILEKPQPKETLEENVCPYNLEDEEEPIEAVVDEVKEEKLMAEIAANIEEVEEKSQQEEKSLEAEKETMAEVLDEGEEEETIGHLIEPSHEKPLENWGREASETNHRPDEVLRIGV
ncbi:hypothetical protein H6P81_006573 [Aristolochia fimbriata]|uniref:Uncharacterized protein n=1 Tax=Aristolochia fimbriata TaxID=158543 RepID=A0AAV7EZ25_ARIFI|nr:hypothetical protein H6P81_006573 [Aristolochia fimbriata]